MISRICAVAVLLASLAVAPGCFGFGGKRSDTAAAGRPSLDDLSPEASMERDLALLRDEERAQAARLDDARRTGDAEAARREEERLRDIRIRIGRYNAALQRGGAGQYGGLAVTPARVMESGMPGGALASAAPMYSAMAAPAYAVPAAQPAPFAGRDYAAFHQPAPAAPAPSTRVDLQDGERLVYAPGMDMASIPGIPADPSGAMQPERRIITEPGTVPPAVGAEGAKPFGGATMGRANYPRTPRLKEAENWNAPESLYAHRETRPQTPEYPGLARAEERVEWPPRAPAARPPEAARPRPAPARTDAPARPAARPPEADTASEGMGDEIFVPDLYLSGR